MTEERKHRVLTEHDLADLSDMISKSRVISDDLHLEHHQFIVEWINKTRRRAEMFDKIRAQVGGWGVIVILGGIGFAVWDWVKTHLR